MFANPRPEHGARLLTPGMFARVRLPLGQPHQAVLVAERALGVDQGSKFLYVVNSENKVEYRRVKTGALQPDGMRVIEDGVKPGEWVIVSGLQLVRPNGVVSPDRTTMQAILNGVGGGSTTNEESAGESERGSCRMLIRRTKRNSQRASAKERAAPGESTEPAAPAKRDSSDAPEDRAPKRAAPSRGSNLPRDRSGLAKPSTSARLSSCVRSTSAT